MPMDRFLIAPINSGLVTDTKSWQILDDAFEYLQNAYTFRGRLRKRFGSQLMGTTPAASRLRINIGTVSSNVIPGVSNQLQIGQQFSVGTDIFTIYQLGAAVLTLSTNPAVTATIDNTSNPNTVTFTGESGGETVYYYPSLPVMGIDQYLIGSINNHPTYAFDTQFAYTFVGGAWEQSVGAMWNGTNINYFWAGNWQSITGTPVLFVSNFNATLGASAPAVTDDPIWSLNNTTWTAASGTNAFFFRPAGGAPFAGPFVQTARIIVAFKNRLLLLNTIENDNSSYNPSGPVYSGTATAYPQRVRYSFYGSPFVVNAWYEKNQTDSSGNVGSGGGYVDASTEEQIIGAEFIKDRLIVYFERSTWELVYTQNQVQPFVWQKINTELGSQSTFSVVPFDRDVLTIGNTGVHACNAQNVRRIDQKIPDNIFEFETENNATLRTCGIRDYYTEMVYWAYVSDIEQATQTFPNKILTYNYQNGSWSINDDCFTTFGYFEQGSDTTWASSAPVTWSQFNGTWVSNVLQANQRQILGGTPEGFVLIIDVEEDRNAPCMSITNILYNGNGILTLTIIQHNLDANPTQLDYDDDFILIENVTADTATENFLNGSIFQVNSVIDSNTITIDTQGGLLTGLYDGGGTCARVSNIQIKTKNFNPYVAQNRNVYVAKADFAVEKTTNGAITVDYYTSYAPLSMIAEGEASESIVGNGVLETFPYDPSLYPLEQYQSLLWHPIYLQSQGEFIQLVMYFSLDQMITPAIALAPFELQAICLYTQPTNDRMS